jgi:hypothetical protein
MKKIAVIFIAASVCFVGRTGVSLAADNYYSCVREAVSQCQYLRDEWESCRDLYVDIVDMCRSLYPRRSHR